MSEELRERIGRICKKVYDRQLSESDGATDIMSIIDEEFRRVG